MNHKHKVKLARKLRTQDELKSKTPLFQTLGWEIRKARIKRRVAKSQLEPKQKVK